MRRPTAITLTCGVMMASCVEWEGYRNAAGYGLTRITPDGQRYLAHRYEWMTKVGPIPGGLLVLHKCDNPPCINTDHLFLGTHGDNARDRSAKGRSRHQLVNAGKTHCPHGHLYDESNTYFNVTPYGSRTRNCRTCHRERELMRKTHLRGE